MSNEKLTKKLQAEVAGVLKNHMPEYVCGVVKERLEEADRMESELETKRTNMARMEERIKELEGLDKLRSKLEQDKSTLYYDQCQLDKDRADFERNKELFEVKTRLAAQNSIVVHIMTVNENLTKNVERRRRMYTSEDLVAPGYTDQYGAHFPPSTTGYRVNKDEDITESTKLEGEM